MYQTYKRTSWPKGLKGPEAPGYFSGAFSSDLKTQVFCWSSHTWEQRIWAAMAVAVEQEGEGAEEGGVVQVETN